MVLKKTTPALMCNMWEGVSPCNYIINSPSVSPAHHSLQPSLCLSLFERRPAVGEGAVPLRCQQEVLSGEVLSNLWTDWPLDHSDYVQQAQPLRLPGLTCFFCLFLWLLIKQPCTGKGESVFNFKASCQVNSKLTIQCFQVCMMHVRIDLYLTYFI